jgi:spermidine/putrescine-binding protein
MKTSPKAARTALAAALCAGALAARAAPSSCTVATTPGYIDTRDAAPSGAGAAIVVETRPGDTNATASGAIDTDTDFAFILIVK